MILLLMLFLCKEVVTMESSKGIEGYPLGYMSDCPGSTKPSIITKKSLRQLFLITGLTGSTFNNTHKRYNYYQMEDLAKDPSLDFSRMTVVFVTGFMDNPNYMFSRLVADAYSKLGYNVLVLDTYHFNSLEYPICCRLTPTVGKHAAEMLSNLTLAGLDPKKLQLIGLSLGGQTISFIGKSYRQLTGVNISRITGLDPAGPCFRNLGPDQRIDASDADFVDIISTNIDGYGMAAPVGHVQFYINGGEFQPSGLILWYNCGMVCSHIHVLSVWLAALKYPKSFIGIQCESVQQARNRECYDRYPLVTNVLGLNTDRNRPGIYYLATTADTPYYMGSKGLKKKNDFIMKSLKSYNDIDVYVI